MRVWQYSKWIFQTPLPDPLPAGGERAIDRLKTRFCFKPLCVYGDENRGGRFDERGQSIDLKQDSVLNLYAFTGMRTGEEGLI